MHRTIFPTPNAGDCGMMRHEQQQDLFRAACERSRCTHLAGITRVLWQFDSYDSFSRLLPARLRPRQGISRQPTRKCLRGVDLERGRFPCSNEHGPIEAVQLTGVFCMSSEFPRSNERGPIEMAAGRIAPLPAAQEIWRSSCHFKSTSSARIPQSAFRWINFPTQRRWTVWRHR